MREKENVSILVLGFETLIANSFQKISGTVVRKSENGKNDIM